MEAAVTDKFTMARLSKEEYSVIQQYRKMSESCQQTVLMLVTTWTASDMGVLAADNVVYLKKALNF